MSLTTWFYEIKLLLYAKLNYKRLTKEYLQNKRRKAAEEIKNLKSFTQWPTAKVKITYSQSDQGNIVSKKETTLHYLPFHPYERKIYKQKQVIKKHQSS